MKNGNKCIHEWRIDSPDRGFRGKDDRYYIKGQCQKCSKKRYFVSDFTDTDNAGFGTQSDVISDIGTDKSAYEYNPNVKKIRSAHKIMPTKHNTKMTDYEVGGCGYACTDSLNCPYDECIYDNPRIARMSMDTYDGYEAAELSGRDQINYILILHRQGLTIEEIIKMTRIPYRKVWNALSSKSYKDNKI